MQTIRFSRDKAGDFSSVLRARVRIYFQEKGISRHANAQMVFKTIFMISLYFTPYILIMTGVATAPWELFLCYTGIGLGIGGCGLSIMHDANHGAYSKSDVVNNTLGHILNIIGGYALTWKLQHNVLHHSFTNIEGHDEDIAPPNDLMRFSPHAKRKKMHKYQHIYAWFLYGLMTLTWTLNKDFGQLYRYHKMGLLPKGTTWGKVLTELIIWRVIYIGYMLVLPLIVLDIPWYAIVLGYVWMHFVAGLILAIIFQPAHVVPVNDYPLPKDGTIENSWFIHQMHTTANFAPTKKLFSWYVGGLNYQVEHHLFPNVCHVHYPAISKIVKQTAEEFNVPYKSYATFREALWEHTKLLKQLGNSDHYQPQPQVA